MSNKIRTDNKYYNDIADEINILTGEDERYKSSELAEAIRNKLTLYIPKLTEMWGVETEVGDDKWWNTLKKATVAATPEERQAMLGKTKRVSLFSPVLGSNQVLMRCVGYDLDGSKTLTFAAVSALAQGTVFDDNSAVWIGSNARAKCQEFYNACSAKNAILTVRKGTCPNINTGSTRNDDVVYNDETVFLMSEMELGLNNFSPISTANSEPNRAECTYGKNEPYQYFTGNDKRIFYMGDANGDPQDGTNGTTKTFAYPWERSRCYTISSGVCTVHDSGVVYISNYNRSNGVLPAFAVGQA